MTDQCLLREYVSLTESSEFWSFWLGHDVEFTIKNSRSTVERKMPFFISEWSKWHDKLAFLHDRYYKIGKELEKRIKFIPCTWCQHLSQKNYPLLWNNYHPTGEDLAKGLHELIKTVTPSDTIKGIPIKKTHPSLST